MQRHFLPIQLLVIASLATGCARYHRRDLNAAASEAAFRDRTLNDPGLYRFVTANSVEEPSQWPPPDLDLRNLTLVAFYFHPDLDVARAKVATAEAGIKTAGARPNPTLSVTPGYSINPENVSPWLLDVGLDIPIETAGKRGYRVDQAKALTDVARLELAQVGWQVRSRLRAALLDHLLAQRQLEQLQAEESARSKTVSLLERRLDAGQVSVVEVDVARTDRDTAMLALQAARGNVAQTQAALAAAAGLPASALADVKLDWPAMEHPPSWDSFSPRAVQRAGLLNRIDVRAALAEYAATDAALRLEIAKQYPDLRLAPGYSFDEGDNKFALGVSVEIPLFNQNQGPIAEAQARRREVAARFLAMQAQVIGQTEQAMAQARSAWAELDEANRLVALQTKREQTVRRSVEVGEEDLLTLASARVQTAVTARSRLDALRKEQAALGALEDAVERPLDDGADAADVPTSSPRDDSKEETKP